MLSDQTIRKLPVDVGGSTMDGVPERGAADGLSSYGAVSVMIRLFSKLSTRTIGALVLAVALAIALFVIFGVDKGPNGSIQRPVDARGAMHIAAGTHAVAPAAAAIPPSTNFEVAIQLAAAKVNAKPQPPFETRTSWEGMSFAEAAAAFAAAASAANVEISVASPFGALEPGQQKEPVPRWGA